MTFNGHSKSLNHKTSCCLKSFRARSSTTQGTCHSLHLERARTLLVNWFSYGSLLNLQIKNNSAWLPDAQSGINNLFKTKDT